MESIIARHPLGQFLCCAIADDPAWHRRELKALWLEVGDEAAWQFAREHEAEGMAAIALERALGSALPGRWEEARQRVASRLQHYMSEMDRVAAALAVEKIRLIALKNAGIARAIFADLGGCPMGDVDLLVRPTDFAAAHRIFMRNGFQLLGNQEVGRAALGARQGTGPDEADSAEVLAADMLSGGREYRRPIPEGDPLWFELQCRSVGGKWVPAEMEPVTDELVARSVEIPGTCVRLLSPEDNLLQVALHTAKHTYVRVPGLRLHTDVDRIVRHCPLDWEVFCRQVEKSQVKTAVGLSLLIPRLLLHTPIPEAVLERLGANRWKIRCMLRWLRWVGFFHPRTKKWSKLGYIGFNLLLYDTSRGVWRALFPRGDWMIKRYGIRHRFLLPVWYLVRAGELLIKRAQT